MSGIDMTCFSCRHSQAEDYRGVTELVCTKRFRPANEVCEDFCYEPGSDEPENRRKRHQEAAGSIV
jgi:hypothetical protein